MRRLATLTVVLSLAFAAAPAVAQPHHHHAKPRHAVHHVNRHVQRARAAWVVLGGCEEPGAATWAEWRAEMIEEGFTQPETEALEIC
jgi:hypothetical protein